jgi:starch synthase
VITTVNSGGADLFQDGEEGFLTPIRDPAALAARMQQLADDPALRERMSHAALARGRALGGWEATERLLVETLNAITTRAGSESKFTPATA